MTGHALRATALVLIALLPSLPSYAQATRIPRIGCVMVGTEQASVHLIEAFRQGLRELGYVEGRNIQIDFRWQPPERPDLLPGIVSELVRSNPDVLVGPTAPQALALKQATSAIPIIMVVPSDPVGTGLVQSLARPGGNITGLALMSHDLMGKSLELLKETLPKMSRLGHVWHPDPATRRDLEAVEAAARTMGVSLQTAEVRDANDIAKAFSSLRRARVEAIIVHADQVTWVHRKLIASLALQNRLPTMFFVKEYVDVGGLMSYGANAADLFRRAASYVAKILAGANPADLPVEQPTKFELVINERTAKSLRITIPEAIRLRVVEVVR